MRNTAVPQQLYNQVRCSQCWGFFIRYLGFWSVAIKWSIYAGMLFVLCSAISLAGPFMSIIIKGFAISDIKNVMLSGIIAAILLSVGLGPYLLAYFLKPVMKLECLHCGYRWKQKAGPKPTAKWFVVVTFLLIITLGAGMAPMFLLASMSGGMHD